MSLCFLSSLATVRARSRILLWMALGESDLVLERLDVVLPPWVIVLILFSCPSLNILISFLLKLNPLTSSWLLGQYPLTFSWSALVIWDSSFLISS